MVNLLLSVVGSVACGLSVTHIVKRNGYSTGIEGIPFPLFYYLYNPVYEVPFIIVPIFGLLLTLLVLNSMGFICCSCFSRPNCNFSCRRPLPNCCCSCFSLPKVEYGALVISKPYSHFVLDAKGKPKLSPDFEEAASGETNSNDPETANDEEADMTENQEYRMVDLVADRAEE